MSGTMMPTMYQILVVTQLIFLKVLFLCPSEDMSPYCSAHDEWLIMKLCMYVGYHDANNVSNFGGDPMTQLNCKKCLVFFCVRLKTCRHIARRMMNG